MNKTIILSKNHLKIKVEIKHGIISNIERYPSIHFPYVINQPYNRNIETWADINGWLIDGKPVRDERIFGIRKKDIPVGHPLHYIRR
jgi:hypothetical protein